MTTTLSAEDLTVVESLERQLSQVKDHPIQEFRDFAAKLEAEIAEWKRPAAPTSAPKVPTAEEFAAAVDAAVEAKFAAMQKAAAEASRQS